MKEGLSLGFDSATGKFDGDFGDILVAMNEAGLKGAGTGMLNGFVQRATPDAGRYRYKTNHLAGSIFGERREASLWTYEP